MDIGNRKGMKKEEYKREERKKEIERLVEASNGTELGVKEKDQFFERLMTVEELADAFGFAPQTIRNWVALRRIPYVSIGGRTRFRRQSVHAWLERKEFRACQ